MKTQEAGSPSCKYIILRVRRFRVSVFNNTYAFSGQLETTPLFSVDPPSCALPAGPSRLVASLVDTDCWFFVRLVYGGGFRLCRCGLGLFFGLVHPRRIPYAAVLGLRDSFFQIWFFIDIAISATRRLCVLYPTVASLSFSVLVRCCALVLSWYGLLVWLAWIIGVNVVDVVVCGWCRCCYFLYFFFLFMWSVLFLTLLQNSVVFHNRSNAQKGIFT